MITRIVKLTIQEDKLQDFLAVYQKSVPVISTFDGCHGVDLLQQISHPNVVFTYSRWASEEDLNNYRQSAFFEGVWKKAKSTFSAKAEAWTLSSLENTLDS